MLLVLLTMESVGSVVVLLHKRPALHFLQVDCFHHQLSWSLFVFVQRKACYNELFLWQVVLLKRLETEFDQQDNQLTTAMNYVQQKVRFVLSKKLSWWKYNLIFFSVDSFLAVVSHISPTTKTRRCWILFCCIILISDSLPLFSCRFPI